MSGPKHLPLIAWSRSELQNTLWEHEQAVKNLYKELNRRGDRDEKRHGFPISIHEPGVISTAYRHFATAPEAFAAAIQYAKDCGDGPGGIEEAPYRVHAVYLGKDDK